MPSPEAREGWDWLEPDSGLDDPQDMLCRCAAAVMGTTEGRMVLRHLERTFLDRRVAASASDAELRHVEGQRSVVAHLLRLVRRGRAEPPGPHHQPSR